MDYNEYRNDLREWIEYNIYGLNYCLEKEKLISLISEVLERLPSEDQEIMLYKRQVRFIAKPFDYGRLERDSLYHLSFYS